MKKKETVLALHKLGFTNKEIEEKTKLAPSSIRWAINSEGLASNRYSEINFKSDFFEFILGNMLGDGCIQDNRFSVAHSLAQEEYCKFKHKFLEKYKLAGKLCYNTITSDRYKKGYFQEVRFKSFSHSKFKELKNIYYKESSRKIVPEEHYLSYYLTPFALAVWFQDDGNSANYNLQLNTQSFSTGDINKLRYVLLEKYGIKTAVNSSRVITILRESIIFFCTLINPYVTDSMQYKILPTRVLNKQGELLEHPEEDNQQPSLEGDFFEGSTTSRRETSLIEESVISTTSALQSISSGNKISKNY